MNNLNSRVLSILIEIFGKAQQPSLIKDNSNNQTILATKSYQMLVKYLVKLLIRNSRIWTIPILLNETKVIEKS